MKPPRGLAEIRAVFGTPPVDPDDAAETEWRRKILAPAQYPASIQGDPKRTKIWCHRLLVTEVENVLRVVHAIGKWHKVKTIGCYNFRAARGLKKLSTHCWGIALDINSATNALGTAGDMDPEIVAAFERHGWTWGGRWTRKDAMHYQWTRGGY